MKSLRINFYSALSIYFSRLPKRKCASGEFETRLEELFINKLLQRFNEFCLIKQFADLKKKFAALTGRDFEVQVAELIGRLRNEILQPSSGEMYFSHGDMSFSNILYDLETKEICFVDPRGTSVQDPCFRPIEYDLAKLSHSALGGYEFISQGFDFRGAANGLAEKHFLKFFRGFSISRNKIRLLEASLFWSLLPLHVDFPEQLLQFMLAGEHALMAG